MLIYSLLSDTCGQASWLTLGDQTFVVRTLNQTIWRTTKYLVLMLPINRVNFWLGQSKQELSCGSRSKVGKQTKHVRTRKLENFHHVSLFCKCLEKWLTLLCDYSLLSVRPHHKFVKKSLECGNSSTNLNSSWLQEYTDFQSSSFFYRLRSH